MGTKCSKKTDIRTPVPTAAVPDDDMLRSVPSATDANMPMSPRSTAFYKPPSPVSRPT